MLLHLDMLPSPQRELWPRLRELPGHFVLYGGTALALRLGHRISEDFDFFSSERLEPFRLRSEVPMFRTATVLQQSENTLEMRVDGVRVSLLGGLTFGQIRPPDLKHALRIASLEDLFATKLNTVYQRNESKDYLDTPVFRSRR